MVNVKFRKANFFVFPQPEWFAIFRYGDVGGRYRSILNNRRSSYSLIRCVQTRASVRDGYFFPWQIQGFRQEWILLSGGNKGFLWDQ